MDSESSSIRAATSAYSFFQREYASKIKQELESSGKDASFGSVAKECSIKWKSLPTSERNKFEKLHSDDKARYQKECERRDAEVEAVQASKRADREKITVEGSRERKELVPKEERTERHVRTEEEMTEEEIARKRAREAQRAEAKAARLKREEIINNEAKEHAECAAKQAEARLQYLLKQSDIFKHFGDRIETHSSEASSLTDDRRDGLTSPAKHRQLEKTESEKFDAQDLGEEEKDHTFLLQQPSIISGGTLRPYQLEGLNWMIRLQENGLNGVLADEMGLGKTLQSISIIAYMREYRNIAGPHLILLPKSTMSNWMNEFKRFCPSIRPVKFHGDREERERITAEVLKPGCPENEREWDVLITTYEMANLEKSTLSKFAWKYLVIDEAHRLKNEASMFSQTVRQFNAMYRLLLTGTPLQNNLHELWALLNFLLPDVFSSSEQFDAWFNLSIDDSEAKQRMISQLHKILRPFMLRRLKQDVETSLPPKKETILFTGMSLVQKNLYRQILLRDIDTINNSAGKNSGRTAILNIVMQLRKCCNHPYLFPGIEDRTEDPLGEHVVQNCGKMVLLDKLLAKLKEREHRVLIFSQMTRTLDILEDFMAMRQYSYCRIDGNTTYEDREDMIDVFNKPGSEKFIFLLSTRAGGLGINLQTADTCILYDSDWNPQADLQAQDRCHRIGQKKKVHIYRLVTENSIEEKVVERAQKKLKLDAMVVQQGRLQNQDSKMSVNELLDALRFGADQIFRSKDSEITDEDIDAILERGEKKTQELTGKLEVADKGDLLDFKLDGGIGTQQFEGVDYSDRSNRAQGPLLPTDLLLDIGKRERRQVQSFGESYKAPEIKKLKKVPKHLRLPKHLLIPNNMMPWHFYNRARLVEIQEEEEQLWHRMVESDVDPKTPELKAAVQLLDEETQQEKTHLLAAGFGEWTKQHLQHFLRAAAKYGRNDLENIAKDVGKDLEDVQLYSAAFWERGAHFFEEEEWGKMVTGIERGEGKIEEWKRIQSKTIQFLACFEDPWNQAMFQHVSANDTGKRFTPEEDRLLLCLAKKCGFGNWDKLYIAVRKSGALRFGYYVRALSMDELGKRVEHLMRTCERELTEAERKNSLLSHKQEQDRQAELARLEKELTAHSDKLAEFSKTLEVLANQLNNCVKNRDTYSEKGPTQAEINKVLKPLGFAVKVNKENSQSKMDGVPPTLEADRKLSPKRTILESDFTSPDRNPKSQKVENGTSPTNKKSLNSQKAVPSKLAKSNGSGGKQQETLDSLWKVPASTFPEEYLPSLVCCIQQAGQDGIDKIVDTMISNHPNKFSKRSVKIQISEVAVKEKRDTSAKIIWYIKPEFEKYLSMPQIVSAPNDAASSAPGSTKKAAQDDEMDDFVQKKKPKQDAKEAKPPKQTSGFDVFVEDVKAEAQRSWPTASPQFLMTKIAAQWANCPDKKKYEARAQKKSQAKKATRVSSTAVSASKAEKAKVVNSPIKPKRTKTALQFFIDERKADAKSMWPQMSLKERMKQLSSDYAALADKSKYKELAQEAKNKAMSEVITSTEETIVESQSPKKHKVARDPNKPKKALTAYLFYLAESKEETQRKYPQLSSADLMKQIAQDYKEIADKSTYEAKAKEAKIAYEAQMEKYQATLKTAFPATIKKTSPAATSGKKTPASARGGSSQNSKKKGKKSPSEPATAKKSLQPGVFDFKASDDECAVVSNGMKESTPSGENQSVHSSNKEDSKENIQPSSVSEKGDKSGKKKAVSKKTDENKKRRLNLEEAASTKTKKPKKVTASLKEDVAPMNGHQVPKPIPKPSPAKPRSAFIIWSAAHKDQIVKNNPEKSLGDLADMLQSEWAMLTDEERTAWDNKHEKEKIMYQANLEKNSKHADEKQAQF